MSLIVLLSLGAGACYVLATVAIKRWDAIGIFEASCLIAMALTGAVLLETEPLRLARLSYVFIMILGFEVSFALLCGWVFFHESYAFPEIMGLLLIVVGAAMTRLRVVTYAAGYNRCLASFRESTGYLSPISCPTCEKRVL